MQIRIATSQDLEGPLLELFQENVLFHYQRRPDYFFNGNKETCQNFLQKAINNQTFLLLENEEGKIVGFVYYLFKNEGKNIIWISELYIAEGERKKGYGKLLIDEIKKIGKEKGCSALEFTCRWFNQNALEMYSHIGMQLQRVIFETNL